MTENNLFTDYVTYADTNYGTGVNYWANTYLGDMKPIVKPTIVTKHIILTQEEMKLSKLTDILCEDCLSQLIGIICKDIPEHIAYYVMAVSTCSKCYNTLLEKELISQDASYVNNELIGRSENALWINQTTISQS